MFLTKNDFLVARTCPTKLYYKKFGYASILDDDPYREFLADGGYMVEAMAKLLFPDGREVGQWEEPMRAFQETRESLAGGDTTLFEATVVHENLLTRVDILQRQGAALHVIEVKSSSFNSETDGANPFRGKKGGIASEWREYLEDIAFQTVVLQRAFPESKVVPFLCIVDKAKSATENATFDDFRVRRSSGAAGLAKTSVEYLGNADSLRKQHVLAILDVTSEVGEIIADVAAAAEEFAKTLTSSPIQKIGPTIGVKCKKCEFRTERGDEQTNGFHECWGPLAEVQPHVLDLFRVDALGGKNRDVVAEMVAKNTALLTEVPNDAMQGAYAARQSLQIEYTKNNREFISDKLPAILATHPYPLYFIDFECSRIAVPYHAGMRPYEISAFQWSCNTISHPGGEVKHAGWLNADEVFPSFEFARTLKSQIGEEGTVYIWSNYEITVLREIRQQMDSYGLNEPELGAWLDRVTTKENPRVVDLLNLAKDHYFHPLMGGSLSVKYALRAAWTSNNKLRANPVFAKYVKTDEHGRLLDPYLSLPPLPIGEKEEVVQEGTGAMRVYQEMMFGFVKEDATRRESYRKLLLQYCELDTLAMVFLWTHWLTLSGQKEITPS